MGIWENTKELASDATSFTGRGLASLVMAGTTLLAGSGVYKGIKYVEGTSTGQAYAQTARNTDTNVIEMSYKPFTKEPAQPANSTLAGIGAVFAGAATLSLTRRLIYGKSNK